MDSITFKNSSTVAQCQQREGGTVWTKRVNGVSDDNSGGVIFDLKFRITSTQFRYYATSGYI